MNDYFLYVYKQKYLWKFRKSKVKVTRRYTVKDKLKIFLLRMFIYNSLEGSWAIISNPARLQMKDRMPDFRY